MSLRNAKFIHREPIRTELELHSPGLYYSLSDIGVAVGCYSDVGSNMVCLDRIRAVSAILTWLGLVLQVMPTDSQDHLAYGSSIKVTTLEIEPYVMVRDRTLNLTDPARYEGYIIDLVHKISEVLGFRYQISPVKDNSYGYIQSDGTWDGMIGQLMRKEVDIAAAPLYVTRHRSEVVDFTRPFLDVYATILIRRPPTGKETSLKSVKDLVHQQEYRYGTLNTGVIIRAFRRSNNSLYQTIWRKMKAQESSFTHTNEEGIERCRKENFAFILPSTIGDYISRRYPCDLVTVDKFLMQRGYGLAVQKGSALLPKLNKVLVLLEVNGFLHRLYQKWWIKRSECNGIKTSKHTLSFNSAYSVHYFPHNLALLWLFLLLVVVLSSHR